MKICIENLDAIIEKYQPLLLSMANRFDIFDKNEAYIMARDMAVSYTHLLLFCSRRLHEFLVNF